MKAKISLFVIIFFLFSCRKKEYFFITEFPVTEKITYTPVDYFKQIMPRSVIFRDSLMIVTDWKENPRIKIYNKNTHEYLGNYGEVGRGPSEFLEVDVLNQSGSTQRSFYCYDYRKKQLVDIDVDKIFRGLNPVTRSVNLRKEEGDWELSYRRMFVYDDTVLGEDNWHGLNKKFLRYDMKTKKHEWVVTDFYEKVPLIKNFLEQMKEVTLQANFAMSFLGYSLSNNRIIGAMLLMNRIDIMDFDFQVKRTIIYGKNILRQPQKFDGAKTCFLDPFTLDKTFLVPYIGFSEESIEKNNGLGEYEIHQYDYEGNPLRKFIIDKPVSSLHYDEQTKTLYAILDSEYAEQPLVKLDINADYL